MAKLSDSSKGSDSFLFFHASQGAVSIAARLNARPISGAAERDDEHGRGPRLFQDFRAFIHRRAGGENIIKHDEMLAANLFGNAHLKGVFDIFPAVAARRNFPLRGRLANANQILRHQRQMMRIRDMPGEEFSLIVAALLIAGTMERHGQNDSIHGGIEFPVYRLQYDGSEQVAQTGFLRKFELMNRRFHHAAIKRRRDRPVKKRRRRLTFAAEKFGKARRGRKREERPAALPTAGRVQPLNAVPARFAKNADAIIAAKALAGGAFGGKNKIQRGLSPCAQGGSRERLAQPD